MDLSLLTPEGIAAGAAVGGLLFGLLVRSGQVRRREVARRSAAWDSLGPALRWNEQTRSGELEGYRIEVRGKVRGHMSDSELTEVRAIPHHPLPRGLVIAPRPWLGMVERLAAVSLVEAPSRLLGERYVIQCDARAEARSLLAQPEVIRALEALPHDTGRKGRRASYVEDGAVGTGWEAFVSAEHSYLEPLRRAVAVAQAFDRAAEALEALQAPATDGELWRRLTGNRDGQ